MANFKMVRSYESPRVLDTQDLLTAVKTVCNYEGDLYDGNRLVMSCLGLSRTENTRRLLEYGITSYVNQRNQCWNYRYSDPSKNLGNYYVSAYHYPWGDEHKIDFTIKEYRESEKDHMFTSLAGVMEFVRNTVAASPFSHNMDEDIHVRLFGGDGLIYFAAGDWEVNGEPEMYMLVKDGHKPEFGAKHYLQKRYEKLQSKFGGYEFIPADTLIRNKFEDGDVVLLETAVDGLVKGWLYLITEIDKSGEQPVITIRDLDDYEVSANVSAGMITIPVNTGQMQMV
ncbi:hypothetical protein [Paenibacillus oralis]|nr:hypothetical protein [Paenibacillus oralis]